MDLLCCEPTENEIKAYDDPTLLQDRVLRNLLKLEDRYVLPYPASFAMQSEVTPEMRKIVAEWMMEVCEGQKCQDEVFSLAASYMDRFLMCCNIMKSQLQLLGTACMLLASKLRETSPMAGETLVLYTDHSVTKQQLWKWELLVLSKLKWDIAAVTPHDFLKHLLNRLPMNEDWNISYEMVLNHAKTIITLCAIEFAFSRYHPSIVACASIVSALDGVGWVGKSGQTLGDLLQRLTDITCIEKDYVEQCLSQIDKMIRETSGADIEGAPSDDEGGCDPSSIRPSEFTPPPTGKSPEHQAAITPTDVHDVHF